MKTNKRPRLSSKLKSATGSEQADLNPKYGFVVLLDALGTRTASLDKAKHYLSLIRTIEEQIKGSLQATLSGRDVDPQIFDTLSIRFFGDTLLITYEIKDAKREAQYFERIAFVLQLFLCRALELGLMFRGSLSIGNYVDKDSVVLGPAISDAATWYEELDMMGILLTPHATLSFKQMNLRKDMGMKVWVFSGEAVLQKPSLKTSRVPPPELYLLNWVYGIPNPFYTKEQEIEWFYRVIRTFSIPPGTESKFAHTEAFFLEHYEDASQSRSAVAKEMHEGKMEHKRPIARQKGRKAKGGSL